MAHIFISYVRENYDTVQKLCEDLTRYGVEVWLDRYKIKPGMRWPDAIRQAIREGNFFIACFSRESQNRVRAFMNEELTLAIDELRQYPTDRPWFIPVLLSPCDVPDRRISELETLRVIQWVELYEDWEAGIQKIVSVINPSPTQIPDLTELLGLPTLLLDADLRHPKQNGGWRYHSRGDCDILCTERPKTAPWTDVIPLVDRVWERVKALTPNAFHTTTLFKVQGFRLLRENEEQLGRTGFSLDLTPTDYKQFKGLNDVWGFDGGKFAREAYDFGLLQAENKDLAELKDSKLSNPLSVGCTVITKNSQNREFMGIARRNTRQTATSFRGYQFYVPCGGFVSRTPTKDDSLSPFYTAAREFKEEVGTFDGVNSPVKPEDVTFFAFGRDMAANFEVGLCGEINCTFSHEDLRHLTPGTDFLFEAQYGDKIVGTTRRPPPIEWNIPVEPDGLAHWLRVNNAKANSWVPFGWTEIVLTLVRRFGVADVVKELAPFITAEDRHLRMDNDPQWTDRSPPRPDLLRRLQS